METMTINILNPKARKLIEDLEGLELISINHDINDWATSELYVKELDERLLNYSQNKSAQFTWDEIRSNLKK